MVIINFNNNFASNWPMKIDVIVAHPTASALEPNHNILVSVIVAATPAVVIIILTMFLLNTQFMLSRSEWTFISFTESHKLTVAGWHLSFQALWILIETR